MKKGEAELLCAAVYIFSFFLLINIDHWFNLTVIFFCFTGEGLNRALTLEATYINIIFYDLTSNQCITPKVLSRTLLALESYR